MTSTTNQIHISELRKLLSPLTLEELFQMFNEHTAILSFMRQTDGTLEFSVLDLEGCRQEIELKFQRLENSPNSRYPYQTNYVSYMDSLASRSTGKGRWTLQGTDGRNQYHMLRLQ